MNIQMLRGALLFAVLLLVQVLVFNHIHLFNCATPLLYIYVALLFPRDIPRWAALVSCFIMGFLTCSPTLQGSPWRHSRFSDLSSRSF